MSTECKSLTLKLFVFSLCKFQLHFSTPEKLLGSESSISWGIQDDREVHTFPANSLHSDLPCLRTWMVNYFYPVTQSLRVNRFWCNYLWATVPARLPYISPVPKHLKQTLIHKLCFTSMAWDRVTTKINNLQWRSPWVGFKGMTDKKISFRRNDLVLWNNSVL